MDGWMAWLQAAEAAEAGHAAVTPTPTQLDRNPRTRTYLLLPPKGAFFKPGERFKELVGSPYYVAPEVLKKVRRVPVGLHRHLALALAQLKAAAARRG